MLACVLHQLAQFYGVPGPDGLLIAMPYTHDDLAHMVGATRQWVSMTLRRFAELGLVRVDRRRITVLNADKLALQASTDGDSA